MANSRAGVLQVLSPATGILVLLALFSSPRLAMAQGADAANLTEGQPLHLEDAEAARGAQVQSTFRYSRTYEHKDEYYVSPQWQPGFGQYWHYQISVRTLAGPADRTTSGDVQLLLFRQLNIERAHRPAFAIAGEATVPSGIGSKGLNTRLKAVMSKTVGSVPGRDRIHLNGDWYHNAERHLDERSHYYGAALGYTHAWGRSTALILDFWREQQRQIGQTCNLAEAGLRRKVSGKAVVSLAGSAGIGQQSPKFRVIFSVEFGS
jgi:hypothetical protein